MLLGCMFAAQDGTSGVVGMLVFFGIGLAIFVTALIGGALKRRTPSLPAYPFAAHEAPQLGAQAQEENEERPLAEV